MKNKVTLKLVDGEGKTIEITVPENTMYVTIGVQNEHSAATSAILLQDQDRAAGSVSTRITVDDNRFENLPTAQLTTGKLDDEGFTWATSAEMQVTTNGRIVAVNRTKGYASTIKPIATKPWTRRDIGRQIHKAKEAANE